MKNGPRALSRRSFLLAATAGTAATAAALMAKKEVRRPGRTDSRANSDSGYQLTEHIHNYYRTAKV